MGIDAGGDIGVGVGPGPCVVQGIELGHDQTAGEPGRAGIGTVDGGAGAGERQAPGGIELGQPRQVGRARGKPALDAVRRLRW